MKSMFFTFQFWGVNIFFVCNSCTVSVPTCRKKTMFSFTVTASADLVQKILKNLVALLNHKQWQLQLILPFQTDQELICER
jgi:hypothetical protein